jgi:hypothetical protein
VSFAAGGLETWVPFTGLGWMDGWLDVYIYRERVSQKFPDWPPGARTANGTALCH